MSRNLRTFLNACTDPENFETNPILQDFITPELVDEIEFLLSSIAKEIKEVKEGCIEIKVR